MTTTDEHRGRMMEIPPGLAIDRLLAAGELLRHLADAIAHHRESSGEEFAAYIHLPGCFPQAIPQTDHRSLELVADLCESLALELEDGTTAIGRCSDCNHVQTWSIDDDDPAMILTDEHRGRPS